MITTTIDMSNRESNGISIFVDNRRPLFCRLEALCNSCVKAWKKYGGLDEIRLQESSTLKSITRDARKTLIKYGEHYTMQDDLQARRNLVLYIYNYVQVYFELNK